MRWPRTAVVAAAAVIINMQAVEATTKAGGELKRCTTTSTITTWRSSFRRIRTRPSSYRTTRFSRSSPLELNTRALNRSFRAWLEFSRIRLLPFSALSETRTVSNSYKYIYIIDFIKLGIYYLLVVVFFNYY